MEKHEVLEWLLNNNFCPLPYIHMAIEADGRIRPCCKGEEFETLDVENGTLSELFNSDERDNFVKSFDNNEQDFRCGSCWKNNNEYSYRVKRAMSDDVAYEFTKMVAEGGKPYRKLEYLEIKPGNRCNLSCRICGVWNSSMWTKEDYLWRDDNIDYKNSEQYKYTQKCTWVDKSNIWYNVDDLDQLRYIHIMGGEPMLIKEHLVFLNKVIENHDASKIILNFNTNGTIFPTNEFTDVWEEFKEVKIAISIDDVEQRFEYQRNGASWDVLLKNLKKYSEVQNKKIKITIDPTISIFNIWYLEEFWNWTKTFIEPIIKNHGLYGQSSHFVDSGNNCIQNLPISVKKEIEKKYENSNNHWIRNAVDFMNKLSPDSKEFVDGLEKINFFDKTRGQNFSKVFPEWDQILKKHGVNLNFFR